MPPNIERAQLWAIYLQLLALDEPPLFLAVARDDLKNHLDSREAARKASLESQEDEPDEARAAMLTLVEGGAERLEPWPS